MFNVPPHTLNFEPGTLNRQQKETPKISRKDAKDAKKIVQIAFNDE